MADGEIDLHAPTYMAPGRLFHGRVASQSDDGDFPMMRRVAIGCLALSLAGMATSARAGLVIYAQDTSVNSSDYGYLNIYLSGTSSDLFDNYQVTLSITPIGGATGTVIFAPDDLNGPAAATSGEQPYGYLYPSSASSYIFADDSLDSAAPVNGGAYPNGLGYNATYFTITDMALSSEHGPSSDGAPTLTDPGTLLASLLIQAVSTNPLEQYSVSLVSNGSGGNGDTFFTNGGTSVAYSPSLGTAANFGGTISISSVPEPASIVSAMTAMVLLAGFQSFRRRIRRSRPEAARVSRPGR